MENSWNSISAKPAIANEYYLVFGKLRNDYEPIRVRDAYWTGSSWLSMEYDTDGFDNIEMFEFEELTHWREMPEPPK